jgi:hypothetical protein
MSNNQSTVRDAILIMLDEHDGEIHGTELLARHLNADKPWIIKCVRVIESDGQIEIIPSRGGRGHRTIYRRNPNSPGLPRKRTA